MIRLSGLTDVSDVFCFQLLKRNASSRLGAGVEDATEVQVRRGGVLEVVTRQHFTQLELQNVDLYFTDLLWFLSTQVTNASNKKRLHISAVGSPHAGCVPEPGCDRPLLLP